MIEYNGEPCGLRGFRAKCGDSMQSHHLVSKQMTRGAKRCSEYVEANPHIFRAWICDVHNATLKLADLPEARALLFLSKIKRYTEPVVRAHLEELRSRSKLTHYDWRLDAIMNYLSFQERNAALKSSALQDVHIVYDPAMQMTRIETTETHPEHGNIPPLQVTDEAMLTLEMAQLKTSPLEFIWKRHVWDHHGEDIEYRVQADPTGGLIQVGVSILEKPTWPRASLVELAE